MASYEGLLARISLHPIEAPANHSPKFTPFKAPSSSARRPDMSSFFAKLSQINTSSSKENTHNNPHAVPTPVDMRATYGLLADSYYQNCSSISADDTTHTELLTSLISELETSVDSPPTEVAGVSQEFLDTLDRVDRRKLGDEACPITEI